MLRVDLVERLARHAHEARTGKHPAVLDEPLVTSLGLQPKAVAQLMKELGFRPGEGETPWVWKGRARPRPERRADPSHAFAALAELRRNG
jgi:ATP-dependent RNA helicase SUPV3L1/SUV3